MLKLQAIVYNLEANTLLGTLLYLTKNQQTIFALFNKFTSTKIYPICDKKSLLFVNKKLANTSS